MEQYNGIITTLESSENDPPTMNSNSLTVFAASLLRKVKVKTLQRSAHIFALVFVQTKFYGTLTFLGSFKYNRFLGRLISHWQCVVIIYCNIFLPLLLTILSVYLVPLLTLSCVTVPLSLTP